MLKRWKNLGSKIVTENPWWVYRLYEFEIPGGVRGQYHCVHTEGSSMVVPVTDDGRVVMVNQYRFLGKRESLEFPCGSLQNGRSYEETARLELQEETGFTAGSIEEVGSFNPYNGVTDEICRIFVARGLSIAEARPDETEEFEVKTCGIGEIGELIAEGVIWDGMTMAAWVLAGPRLGGRPQ